MIFFKFTELNCHNLCQYWTSNFEEKNYCTQALGADFCKLICKRLRLSCDVHNLFLIQKLCYFVFQRPMVKKSYTPTSELVNNWDLTWITSINNLLSNLWNSLPSVCAIDLPTLVLPTPGGPTKQRIGPVKLIKS